ncbi:M48 family metalloprotease [Streptomyces sp. NPDC054962]
MSERPDPFVFPDGVKFRFVLLVTALLATSAFVYNLLYYAVAPGADDAVADYQRCIAAPPEVAPVTDPGAYARGVLSCTAAVEQQKAWWILAGLTLLVFTAVALYLVFPWLRMWREGLEPLEPEEDPEDAALVGVLASLVAEAGLRKAPRFLVAMGRREAGALTFGCAGDYRVRLNEGLLIEGRQDPELLRTVVLHELAHVRNKDVDITYLTVALTLAFVPLGLVPLAVALAGTDTQALSGVAWRAAALVALVYLTAAAVLRVREFGADARAAPWGTARAGLLRLLNVPSHGRRRSWWARGPLRLHPSKRQRSAEIEHPAALFRIGFGECFAVGLAATVTASSLHTLLWLGFNHLEPRDSRWVVALMLAPAVVAVVGIGLWRATLWALWTRSGAATGSSRPRTVLPALGLAAGLVAGRLVHAENGLLQPDLLSLFPHTAAVVWSVALCLLVVLFLCWIVHGAAAWLAPTGRPVSRAWPVGLAATAVPLAVLLCWWLLLYDFAHGLAPITAGARADHRAVAQAAPLEPYWLWAALEHPLAEFFYRWTPAALAAVMLWAFPLAALWRRGAVGPKSCWARWVVVPCVVGTGGFAVAALGVRTLVHRGVAEELRPLYLLAFAHWSVAAAVAIQGVVAAVVTAGLYRAHGRSAGLFGLMAAFVTGCLATVIIFGGTVLGGCWDVFALAPGPCAVRLEVSFVRDTLLRVVVAGTASAVVGAGAAAAAGAWWVRRRILVVPPVSVAVSRRQRAVLGLAALLAIVVVTTGLAVPTTTATAQPPSDVSPTSVSGASAPACKKVDEVMGAGDSISSAEKNADLFEAVGLAAEGGNAALATAIQDLVRAVPTGDLPAFKDAGDRIREQCVREGASLRRF